MAETGYGSLVEAAARLTAVDPLVEFAMLGVGDAATIAFMLQRNDAALVLARRALGSPCVVPLRYHETFFPEHSGHLACLRNLMRVFQAEAQSAVHNANYDRAARIGVNILELANAIRRGGLLIDLLLSITSYAVGVETLRKFRNELDADARRLLIDDVLRIESEREAFASVAARDREWEAAAGCEDGGELTPQDLANWEATDEERELVLDALRQMNRLSAPDRVKMMFSHDATSLALMRLLVVDMALRSYRDSRASLPADLSSLAPVVIPQVPLDPFTDRPFIYRPIGDASFLLYSVGAKATDGGGQFGPCQSVSAGLADLCLDAGYDEQDCRPAP